MTGKKKQSIKMIERHLRNYKSYKVAIKNLQKQLDYIMPNITANYELKEGSIGTFAIASTTEQAALDRLESARVLQIHERMQQYQLIVDSINEALDALSEQEKQFIRSRYIEGYSIEKTAQELHCSTQNAFRIRAHALDRLLISLQDVSRVFVELL